MYFKIFLLILTLSDFIKNSNSNGGFTVPNWIHFPYGSPYMGIIVAFATPLDLEYINAFVSAHFEAAYLLPTNQTEYTYPPVLSRAFDFINRKSIYEILEKRLEKFGFEGRYCLLRAICETSLDDLEVNGVLGDLVHLILRPSSSQNEGLSDEYSEAEEYGLENLNCEKYEGNCKTSVLDIISFFERKSYRRQNSEENETSSSSTEENLEVIN